MLRIIALALWTSSLVCGQNPPATANDVKLSPTSPAINAGANLGTPYNLILDPLNPNAPFDQSSGGWVIGAVGATPGFVISGAEITGVITQ